MAHSATTTTQIHSNSCLNAVKQHGYVNHQKSTIVCYLDSGAICFNVIDRFGISNTIRDFVIENLDEFFIERLNQDLSADDQQLLLLEYLQTKLNHASAYQVHIEAYGTKSYIRFGDYGLNGGGKFGAYCFSAFLIGSGIALCSFGMGLVGNTLISSGVCGGLYVYRAGEKYKDDKYLKQCLSGAVGGVIAGSVPSLGITAKVIGKIGSQMLSSAASSAISNTSVTILSGLIENGEVPSIDQLTADAAAAAIGGGIGALAGEMVSRTVGTIAKDVADDVTAIAKNVFRGAVKAGARVFSKKAVTNVVKGRDSTDGVGPLAVLRSAIGGVQGGLQSFSRV